VRRAGRVAGRGVLSRPRVQRLTRPPRPLAVATSNQLALPDWPASIWRLTEFVNCLANVPPRRSTQDGASGEESILPLENRGVNGSRDLVTQGD